MAQQKKCLSFLQSFRTNGFNSAVITAKELAAELGIDPIFLGKRRRTKKRQFFYENIGAIAATPEDEFKRYVFYTLVDTLDSSLKRRFQQIDNHYQRLGFLYNIKELPEKTQVCKLYEGPQAHLTHNGVYDINGSELYSELLHVQSILNDNVIATPIEVLRRINNADLKDLFPNLWVVLRVLLTIPVTVASGERSFSKLKLIKTYLRSTMSEDRLVALAIVSIESDEARKLDFGEVISSFVNAKAPKIQFNFFVIL